MLNKTILILAGIFSLLNNTYGQTTYTYTGKPRFQILTTRNNSILGIINVELFPNIAPHHTRNFDSLVSKSFYDTTAFHRVIPGFMIQGGDPNSRHGLKSTWGYGQPTQPTVNAEFSKAKHLRGTLSAARGTNINSATSQFFICHANAPSLNGQYSVYGRVTSGINYVDTIANAPRDANDNPLNKIEMFITYIGSNDTIPNPPALTTPINGSNTADTLIQVMLKWNAVSDGIIYNVDFSTDSTFTTNNTSFQTANLTYVLPSVLPSNKKYFWRVKTNNGGHFSAYSPVWSFRTLAPLSVGNVENSFVKNSILVYPNPSYDKFVFSNLDKEGLLEIFDYTGKQIMANISLENRVTIDLGNYGCGIYFYKYSFGSNKEAVTGKLIVR